MIVDQVRMWSQPPACVAEINTESNRCVFPDVVRPARAARRDADEPQLRVDVFQVGARATRVEELEGREAREVGARHSRRRGSAASDVSLPSGCNECLTSEHSRVQVRKRVVDSTSVAWLVAKSTPLSPFRGRRQLNSWRTFTVALEGQALRDLVDDEIALQGQRGELRRLARRLRRHALAQAPGAREAEFDEGARLVVALMDAKQPVDGGRDVAVRVESRPELLARFVHCDWRGRRRDRGRRWRRERCVLPERCALQRCDSRCALQRRERCSALQQQAQQGSRHGVHPRACNPVESLGCP